MRQLGQITAPLTTIVGLFAAPLQNLIGLIDARIEQLQAQGETETLEPGPAEPNQVPESETQEETDGGS